MIEPLTPERRRQQTRDHLLQAAAQVFAERGFHGASLDEVAAVAGFSKGAVYSNFKNKEDLFLALLESMYAREMDALQETLHTSPGPPELRLEDFARFVRDQPTLAGPTYSLYEEFHVYALRNPAARKKLIEFDNRDVASVAKIIEAERERWGEEPFESAEDAARIIIALMRGVSTMRTLHRDELDDSFLEAVMRFIARAMLFRPNDSISPL